jgi:ATP-binding cassette subfamily B multidrug efflux pump
VTTPTRQAAPTPAPDDEDDLVNSSANTGRMTGGAAVPMARSRDPRSSLKRLMVRLRRERLGLIATVVLAVLAVTLQVLGPRVLGNATNVVFDGVTGTTDGVDFTALAGWLGLALALFLGAAVLTYVQAWLLTGLAQRAMGQLRADVQAKLDRFSVGHVDRQARGDLLSRVTNDIDNLQQSLQQTMSALLTAVLTMVGIIIMMVLISPILALVAVITLPVSTLVIKGIATQSKKRFVAQWRHTGSLNAQAEEAISAHAIVKAFGRSPEIEARFRETNDELYGASFMAQFMAGLVTPIMLFLGNLNFVIVAVVGGVRVATGQLSLGEIQAFLQYSRQFTMPLSQIASMFNMFQSGLASAERVFDLLDGPEQEPDDGLEPRTGPVAGRVVFDRVDFAYDPARPLIHDLSLVAEPGQTVAIVGPTGAGKTTLVNLLMRFYELDAGTISIDGRNIASMPRRDLRSMMGMVLQDTWLFSGTIRENIAYGDPQATEDQVMEAARAAYVDRFVRSLPDGYDTAIDDQAGNLSVGERQLITIARAFLSDPSILILDEATSSVDTRTEVLIQKAMARLRSDRTSFVIAHRLSTIRDADTILVMEAGSIVEQGDHETLLDHDGPYARLYQAQFAAAAVDLDAAEV